MPRKKQVVQKRKRQKAYRAGEWSGEATHIRRRGAFKLFTNYKLFAIIGTAALAGSFVVTALYRNDGGSAGDDGVRGDIVRTTPEAGSTSTTGAAPVSKSYSAPPTMAIDPNKSYVATLKTDKGDITVELNAKDVPATVNNFVFLANDGFYDGVTFYRVIADAEGSLHYAQAGDPTGTGNGGPGYDLPVEKTTTGFTTGVLAMAKKAEAGAPNNGSQFFFTLQDEPTLDGKFTAFGRVTSGLDVLQQLTPRDPQTQQELEPGVRIQSIEIAES
jgi:cyclophilin family peptidyl-prolyl cis-trans isomerase